MAQQDEGFQTVDSGLQNIYNVVNPHHIGMFDSRCNKRWCCNGA